MTAEQFFEDWCNRKGYISIDEADDIEECLREFALFHVNKALKAASIEVYNTENGKIMNCYAETDIK